MKIIDVIRSINLANKITILRILLVPFFVLFMMADGIPYNYAWALIVFAFAAASDFADGYIARKYDMITNLGKLLDPIADKILVMSALICFAGLGWVYSWLVVVILAREFIVSAVRLAVLENDNTNVIPARASGKIKTFITMVVIFGIICMWMLEGFGIITFSVEYSEIFSDYTANRPDLVIIPISNAFLTICAGLTVFSGAQYVWDARYIFWSDDDN